jgi:hypothetical protein
LRLASWQDEHCLECLSVFVIDACDRAVWWHCGAQFRSPKGEE